VACASAEAYGDHAPVTIALRACAALFAATWLVLPGFGLIDLTVTWDPDWPQALEGGWGLFSTIIVGAAFVLVATRPHATPTAIGQLAVAAVALAVSGLLAEEPGLLAYGAGLAVETGIVVLLFRGRLGPFRARLSLPLLLVGGLGAVPWLVYTSHMWAANRENRPDSDTTVGVDHYSMQGALALSLAVLPLLAAAAPRLRPFSPLCAGVAAFYLAIISLAWPDAAGGLTRAWSLAAAAWALGLVAAAMYRPRSAEVVSAGNAPAPSSSSSVTEANVDSSASSTR
jgi:hypothetical protein